MSNDFLLTDLEILEIEEQISPREDDIMLAMPFGKAVAMKQLEKVVKWLDQPTIAGEDHLVIPLRKWKVLRKLVGIE